MHSSTVHSGARRVRARLRVYAAMAASLALGVTALAGPAHAIGADHHPPVRHQLTQEALDRLVTKAGLPGVAALARDQNGTWSGTAGVADLATGRERVAADHFRAASVTKTFLATVMLQLEAEGALRLDDSVERWLPDVIRGNGNDGRRISVRQLLQQTSGLFNFAEDPGLRKLYAGTGFLEHRYDTFAPEAVLKAALRHRPLFEPGSGWAYSNTNYLVAGMIVDKATGHSYRDEIERRILRPLRLRETYFPGTDPGLPVPHPVAYSKLYVQAPHAEVHDATEYNTTMWAGSADLVSTTGDLKHFLTALLHGDLLPPTQMRAMLQSAHVPKGALFNRYGLGLMGRDLSCGITVWGHDGSLHGSLTHVSGTVGSRHVLAFNINGDWLTQQTAQNYQDVMEAEFCGRKPGTTSPRNYTGLPALDMTRPH
ncbi:MULTISPECIES: serine hydrolase domain-containing protein [Streptomyces]|uniref:serine hydrolase domain-containing protein n=1 Tax=Streptomyces TaxID=1883 RepID=UPI0006BF055C|nr:MULTISPECIES: serine hydrolase domain-containing protein [Streptomyces]KOT52279.1 peptidase [Streptomyces rimosus subsp. rimosus]